MYCSVLQYTAIYCTVHGVQNKELLRSFKYLYFGAYHTNTSSRVGAPEAHKRGIFRLLADTHLLNTVTSSTGALEFTALSGPFL